MFLDDTLRFHATVKDSAGSVIAGAPVAWTSRNDTIATIDATGLATAHLSPASVITSITAVSGNARASAALIVQPCRPTGCGSWSTGPGPTPRRHVASAIINNVLYLVSGTQGLTPGSPGSALVEAYDPATGAWTQKASMPDGRRSAVAATVGGLLYALGGGTQFPFSPTAIVRSYDPSTNTWTDQAPMPTARIGSDPLTGIGVGAATVVNGILYALGDSGRFNAYDPSTSTWTTRAVMPTPRDGVGLAVINGKIFAFGGESFSSVFAAVAVYDPATNTWTSRAPMPTALNGALFTVANGRLYAIGGTVCGTPSCSTWSFVAEAYDPVTNVWTILPPVPVTNAFVSFVEAVNGLVFVGTNDQPACLVYNPATNVWSAKMAMPFASGTMGFSPTTASIGGRLNVVELGLSGLSFSTSALFVLTP